MPADDARTQNAGDHVSNPTEVAPRPELRQPPVGSLQVGHQFGSRYRILRRLGVGGMGEVFQAWDFDLNVAVALKIIRPEIAADPAAARDIERRFKQELLLARQVTHSNVVRIHDLGEIDGIKYITMSYIEGSDLATVLRDERLAVERVMSIARQIADGLCAAHEAGVIHRDLKPANIMLAKDRAVIMDFGIARPTRMPEAQSPSSSGPTHADLSRAGETTLGAVIGTTEYMAPEQARGEPVDQRADIYAFGLIVYDMLVGSSRGSDDLRERMAGAFPRLRAVVPSLPEGLDELVSKCTDASAENSFQTTSELVSALERLDDSGKTRPIKRVIGLRLAAAVVLVLLVASAGVWTYQRQLIPTAVPDPVSVIIADFDNDSGDAALSHTFEPVIRRALQDAGFITAYDRIGISELGVAPVESLDGAQAHAIAVEQGIGIVLSGRVERLGSGYRVAINATRTVTGEVVADEQATAAGKDQVIPTLARLLARVRNDLGDNTSPSAQQFAMASLSATSLDVVRLYAEAMQASSALKFDEALSFALEAVKIDPNFGTGYLIASTQSANLGRPEDERRYLDLALQHLDGMTEREQYHTRGASSLSAHDYEQCVNEYGNAISRYPTDVAAHNQLALCLTYLRQMRRAVQVMRDVVALVPSQPVFRINLALYLGYAGDFEAADTEARTLGDSNAYAVLARAFALLGQDRLPEARQTYESLAARGRRGGSLSASGLADMAALEGRFADAVRILETGVVDDLAREDDDSAAAKLTAIAHAELARGESGAAIEAVVAALQHSQSVRTRYLAARTFAEANDIARAQALVDELSAEPYDESRAYARIVAGLIALERGEAREAVAALQDANKMFDTWLGLFDLGRALLEAGFTAQANSAFEACLNARRGEALALFVDEQPTYSYLAPLYYYVGRARQELELTGYDESYRAYLGLRGSSSEDPLVAEVRRLAAQ
jgi:serine/threonine protein kinase/tetratricopeptide (TPR) repeat protein